MSDNKIPNEEELWSVLDGTAPAAPKTEAKPQKSEAKFAKPGAPKGKIDGFFLTCMAGVAAVSVAATLLISGLTGGGSSNPASPVQKDPVPAGTEAVVIEALELENAELRAQLELQKKQIKDLQTDLINLMGSEQYLATAPSTPEDGGNETLDAQAEAFAIFTQIQEAYADFDRAKLEELIPEMDKRLTYLSNDALQNYYMILEYVEQPSNG